MPHFVPSAIVDGAITFVGTSVDGTQYAEWTISFDGFTYERDTAGAADQAAAWIDPQVGMGLYQVRATLVSGRPPAGTFGTWLPLSDAWTWGYAGATTEKECNITIEIRRASDGVIVGSGSVDLLVTGIE
jgi:hypothetical protein